jgi:hypothetical protein
MRVLSTILLLISAALAQTPNQHLPAEDAVRVREFYRLASTIQDQLWPNWSSIPAPLLLITDEAEFLTHHPSPPREFQRIDDSFYVRPRRFSTDLLATFPAFGPPSVIVIGQPRNTASKRSTPWLITLMHEHFHQLQNAQPGYFDTVKNLGLNRGDSSGMWMLNYAFPYDKPEVKQGFARLRDRLLSALSEVDAAPFKNAANQYVQERKEFFARLSPDDARYLNFQIWQEGIARYTEIKAAEAAAHYRPSSEYTALADAEPLSEYAPKLRAATLDELKRADLAESKRTVVYSFGAVEGLLLDRLNAGWKEQYFKHALSLETLFTQESNRQSDRSSDKAK